MGKIGAFVMITLISGVAVMVAECIQKNNNKDKVKNTAMAVVIADAIMGILYLALKDKYTIYEFIFINIAVAFVCEFFAFPVSKKRKIEKSDVLKLICMESMVAAVYSILTYGQTIIHSDTATATLLSESILKHHSFFPRTWNYANGDIWVLCNGLACILPTWFMNNQSLARMIGSASWLCIVLCGVIYQSKKMYKNDSWVLSIPLMCIFLFESAGMVLYEAAYTGQILWLAICPVLVCKAYDCNEKNKKKYYLVFFILTVLLLMAGIRMMAEQTVPLLGAIMIMFGLTAICEKNSNWEGKIRNLVYMLTGIIIPTALGYGIYKWLTTWHNVNNTVNNQTVFVEDISALGRNTVNLLKNFFECFGYVGNVQLFSISGMRNLISIIVAGLVCFVIPVLQVKKIQQETREVQFFFAFGLIHNLIMIILAVFTGKSEARYLLTSVFICILVAARYVYEYWMNGNVVRDTILVFSFTIATCIECVGLLQSSIGWSSVLQEKKEFNQEIVSRGLNKGYATYWNAYTNEVYSDLKVRYAGVNLSETSITPFRWLVDDDVYKDEGEKTFLLLDESENQLIQSSISIICGEPIDTFTIDGKYIYVFDHDLSRDITN